jgi:hypothetical protein
VGTRRNRSRYQPIKQFARGVMGTPQHPHPQARPISTVFSSKLIWFPDSPFRSFPDGLELSTSTIFTLVLFPFSVLKNRGNCPPHSLYNDQIETNRPRNERVSSWTRPGCAAEKAAQQSNRVSSTAASIVARFLVSGACRVDACFVSTGNQESWSGLVVFVSALGSSAAN